MALDSGHPTPSRLDDTTLAAVRDALRRYLADDSDPGALQQALRRMSTEARARDLRAEQVLVLLKEMWSSLPDVHAMHDTGEQVHQLQRVVTMCIEEYYGG